MASPLTSPLNRPEGSSYILRYRGLVSSADVSQGELPTPVPLATFPKPNGSFPSDAAVVTPIAPIPAPPNPLATAPFFIAYARFALFDPGATAGVLDPAALANYRRRFLDTVYDDSNPAGSAPHPAVAAVSVPGVNDGELVLTSKTWGQNLYVTSSPLDLNVLLTDLATNRSGVLPTGNLVGGSRGVNVLLDTETSGLGLNTGLPVVVVPFYVLAQSDGQQVPTFEVQSFFVDIAFEIRHSVHR